MQFTLFKFYLFVQNNSGGKYYIDKEKGIWYNVAIQAFNKQQAEEIALDKGIYFNGVELDIDCYCCGDRWTSDPSEVRLPQYIWNSCYVHFLNGDIVFYNGDK